MLPLILLLFICLQPKPVDVSVITHHMQHYAVWFGGSMLASTVRGHHIYSGVMLAVLEYVEIYYCMAVCVCGNNFFKVLTSIILPKSWKFSYNFISKYMYVA